MKEDARHSWRAIRCKKIYSIQINNISILWVKRVRVVMLVSYLSQFGRSTVAFWPRC
jgi:hypothetical protein